jgi:aspartyl-tRNA(Asn)/glutamyl-tRNA(Gln) amidotransferase subunit A
MFKADFLTVPPNLAGLPHLSAPCGLVNGMPTGMQFVAPHWREGILISMAEGWAEAFDVPEAGA